ncbi:hypothetical protein O3G_MSEX003037 [Manduca sexta]|uniref:Peptidase S1 domain-containing protein n=1 Tax=Manduca sexta TaxID=7130 RepID=A0A921YRH6_MANSE|nr:hypothetical protein O3G_MSEX003037 [Manduca sexta]
MVNSIFFVYPGTQPRVASLRRTNTQQHICGATILSPEFAITAAHCVHSTSEDYFLQLNNYRVTDDIVPRAIVLEIITHDLYDRTTRAHDIAILRIMLSEIIAWTDSVILPSPSLIGVSGECRIYGYGIKDINSSEATEQLYGGKLKIVSLDQCTNKLGPYVAPKRDGGMLCAVGDGVDACQGDSGSPLICDGVVQGICSYGMGCGANGVPGVYTGIGAHLQWIRDVTQI